MKRYVIIFIFALATLFSCATKKDLAALQEQVDAIKQTEITAILSELEQIRQSLDGLGGSDSELAKKIEGLTTRIGNLEDLNLDQYEGLTTAISGIRQTLAELSGNYSELETALNGLETRLQACEIAIESLRTELASRIQSLTFVPDYYDGKATWWYNKNENNVIFPDNPVLYFDVQPASLASVLASNISSLALRATYTQTRAASPQVFNIPVTAAKVKNGLLEVTGSKDNVDEGVFLGTNNLNVSLLVSDDVRTISSSYVPVLPVKTDYVIFDDPNFKDFVCTQVDGVFGNTDGEVDSEEAMVLVSLDARNSSFQSITGIGMFLSLQTLDLEGNKNIKKIDVTPNRALTSLNVKGCTAIEEMDWDDSKYPALELTCNFQLGHLLRFCGVETAVCHTGDVWKIITLQPASKWWDTDEEDPLYCGATSDDGFVNTNRILATTSTCQAATWCRSLGPKWYLPSVAEINDVGKNYNEIFAKSSVKPDSSRWYWTSNEKAGDALNAGNIHLDGKGNVAYNEKSYTFNTLAMKAF